MLRKAIDYIQKHSQKTLSPTDLKIPVRNRTKPIEQNDTLNQCTLEQ